MKISKLLFLTFSVLIGLFSLSSCGDDVDCDDAVALEEETAELFTAFESAGAAFNADPTNTDLCGDFEDAINDLLSFIDDSEECIPEADRALFDEQRMQIEANLDGLDCG